MKQQIQLSFEQLRTARATNRRQRRIRQARWWFDQMRQVVDRALDRGAAGSPRPEQIYMSLSRDRGLN